MSSLAPGIAFDLIAPYTGSGRHDKGSVRVGSISDLNRQRFLSYSAYYLRWCGKIFIYSAGSVLVKPFLLPRRGRIRLDRSAPLQILFVSLAQRGDFILSLPTVMELKKQFPNSRITCWIRGFNRSLAKLNPAVDQVFVYDDFRTSGAGTLREFFDRKRHQTLLQEIHRRKFDLMIDDTGLGFTAMIGFLAHIPVRIGRNVQGYGFFNHFDLAQDANCQLVERRLKLLRPLGIAVAKTRTIHNTLIFDKTLVRDTLGKFALENGSYITVQPNGGWEAKNWPLDRVAVVVGRLASETQLVPILLGSAGEREELEKMGKASGTSFLNLAGKLELDELAAIIANSSLHLGVDSVGSHLACALGTKSLTIFGPTNPLISHSFSKNNIAVFKRTRCTPRPDSQYCCLDAGRTCSYHACMDEINTDEILQLARQILSSELESSLIEL